MVDVGGGPPLGSVLGSYVLKRLLGAGGMGLVYLAEHEKLKRKVALKLLRPELTKDPVAIRRFFSEARAVNDIGHENIVEVTDFVDEGPWRFFVMELLQGHALNDVMERGRMPLARTIHVARQMAAALAAAHEAGVVHRDLKPPNIFLIKRGTDESFVKVLDFGIAKVKSVDPGEAERTAEGTFIGTPSYMAPEQLASKPCDHRVDVYSFGILLFELVTGLRPFRAMSMAEIIVQQLTVPAPRPSDVMRGAPGNFMIPEKLEELILACLEKDPEVRTKSMRHVERVLAEVAPLVEAVAGTEAQRWQDGTGDYALPSMGGWIVVGKGNPVLTTNPSSLPKPVLLEALTPAAPAASAASEGDEEPQEFVDVADIEDVPVQGLDDASKSIVIGRPITVTGASSKSDTSPTVHHEVARGPALEAAPDIAAAGADPAFDDGLASLTKGRTTAIVAAGAVFVAVALVVVGVASSGGDLATLDAGSVTLAPPVEAPVVVAAIDPSIAVAAVAAAVPDVAVPEAAVPVAEVPVAEVPVAEVPVAEVAPVTASAATSAAASSAVSSSAASNGATSSAVTSSAATSSAATSSAAKSSPTAPTAAKIVEVAFASRPPGATVVVGGKVLGVTPVKARVLASARPSAVLFSLDGYDKKKVMAPFASQGIVTVTMIPVPAAEEPKPTAKDGALINPFKKKPK